MGKRKAPDDDNINQDLCDFLTELADYEKNVSRNIHKYNAYRNAASILSKHPTRIKSGEEARQLKGIGDKIAKKIEEFIETGTLKKLQKIRADDKNVAINELIRVTGIGPAKARELVNDGIMSVEDLKKHKDKLNNHQLIGLKHFEDFEKRVPREEISKTEERLRELIENVDEKYVLTICGSYRRGAESSGDIDGLLTHPSYTSKDGDKPSILKTVVQALKDVKLITDTLSLGYSKFMVQYLLGPSLGINDCSDAVEHGCDKVFTELPGHFRQPNYFYRTKIVRSWPLVRDFTFRSFHMSSIIFNLEELPSHSSVEIRFFMNHFCTILSGGEMHYPARTMNVRRLALLPEHVCSKIK